MFGTPSIFILCSSFEKSCKGAHVRLVWIRLYSLARSQYPWGRARQPKRHPRTRAACPRINACAPPALFRAVFHLSRRENTATPVEARSRSRRFSPPRNSLPELSRFSREKFTVRREIYRRVFNAPLGDCFAPLLSFHHATIKNGQLGDINYL